MTGLPDDADDDALLDGMEGAETASIASQAVRRKTASEAVVPIVEERAWIDKHAVETGRVRVSTHTETTEQVLRESLRSDTVDITRVPVNRTLVEGEAIPVTRTEGRVTVIPVFEEILVVEKRLVLKEEVHIRHTTSDEDVEVPVTLHKQRAVVERVFPDGHDTQEIKQPNEVSSS